MTSVRLGLTSRVSKSNSKSASSVNITKYGSKVSSALGQISHSDLAKPCYTNATPRLPLICQSHDTILTTHIYQEENHCSVKTGLPKRDAARLRLLENWQQPVLQYISIWNSFKLFATWVACFVLPTCKASRASVTGVNVSSPTVQSRQMYRREVHTYL